MFKQLLVPLDGSRLAESALPLAYSLAGFLNASITLIHLLEKNAPQEIHGETHLKTAREAGIYLEKITKTASLSGIRIDYHVHPTEIGNVARSIVEHELEIDFDLIVMCTHGRGGTTKILFGTIAQQVIAKGSTPVLIARPERMQHPDHFQCRSILVPLDNNPDHQKALDVARQLASCCHAGLHLVMIIPTYSTIPPGSRAVSKLLPGTSSNILDILEKDGAEYLENQKASLEEAGLGVTTQILRDDPARGIVKASRQQGIDLMVLGTHGKSGMGAFWAGSVASKVCHSCELPFLLIPVGSQQKDS